MGKKEKEAQNITLFLYKNCLIRRIILTVTHYNKLHQLLGRLSILLLVFGLYFSNASTVLAAGNTIYVSTSGSDSNSGSVSTPVRSFVKAQTLVSAGDIILVEAGTYTENLHRELKSNNEWFCRLTVKYSSKWKRRHRWSRCPITLN